MDKEIVRRLDSMTQLQELTPRQRKNILALVELLETEYGIVLGRRQAEMFISHLAETFRRMDHGETVAYMEEAAAGQLRAFGGSGTVDHMLRDFSRITGVRFPKSEEEYMKMYLSSLLSYNTH